MLATETENVQYILPKDIEELDRLHMQHVMLKFAFQGNFEAPVLEGLKKGIAVLDSGCGPATWALEMAEAFPNSKFYGIDVAPVFPAETKPDNCEFKLGNLNETLPFPDNHFDYIHQRLLVAGLTTQGWKNALSELVRVLKPGGWIELKEIQFSVDNPGPRLEALDKTLIQVLNSKHMVPDVACELGGLLEGKGIENVQVRKLCIPVNHGGRLGELHWADTKLLLTGLKPVLFMVNPTTFKDDESFEKEMDAIGRECADNETYGNWFCAFGQKPLI